MRIHNLTLLSLLLLTSEMLTQKVKNGARHRQSGAADGSSSNLDKTQSLKRGGPPKSKTNMFVSRDKGANCTWVETKQELGTALLVECTGMQQQFSCVFAGNPAECLQHNGGNVYWKQIIRALRKQKNICGDWKSVLKAKVCRKGFPQANLKLKSSTLLENTKPRKGKPKPSPTEHPNIEGASSKELHKPKEDVFSTLAVTKTVTTQGPECLNDRDVEMQRKMALDFCGESWTSLCTFFLNMFQATSC
ncbi:fibroblast growth factor-binding protein 1 [Octodon degus]|uniref:Fibroblast growth factor-binding protein 1 n=1 Tax=Octodon degus TaxID=10160 RepID=A0A6P3EK18_OCTDE|nr:fibroblast growth factor-binding protein 1 [Octodon degus]